MSLATFLIAWTGMAAVCAIGFALLAHRAPQFLNQPLRHWADRFDVRPAARLEEECLFHIGTYNGSGVNNHDA